MKTTFVIYFNDYLTLYLFEASRSERIRKRRLSSAQWPAAAGILFALYQVFSGNPILGGAAFIISLIWYFIYPGYEAQRYVKYYRDFIRENLMANIDKAASVTFTGSEALIESEDARSQLSYRLIEEINEIPEYIFIRFRGGESLILPVGRLTDAEALRTYLQQLAAQLRTPYSHRPGWRWN